MHNIWVEMIKCEQLAMFNVLALKLMPYIYMSSRANAIGPGANSFSPRAVAINISSGANAFNFGSLNSVHPQIPGTLVLKLIVLALELIWS